MDGSCASFGCAGTVAHCYTAAPTGGNPTTATRLTCRAADARIHHRRGFLRPHGLVLRLRAARGCAAGAVNAQFGAGWEASAYYAAFRLPDTLFSLIAGGALSSAMIPVLLSTSREEGENATWRLTNLVLTTLLAVFALVVFVGEIFAPALITTVLAPGFDAETSELTVTLTRIMLVQPLILAGGSVATAVLNSRNQFLLTALSLVSHNVALIAGIVATWAYPDLVIYGPALGVVGGAVLQVMKSSNS